MDPTIKDQNLDVQYDEAVAKRDPLALVEVGKQAYGTELGSAALNSADLIYKTSKEFDGLVAPIEKAGGPATREGRVAVADTWKTVKDNPQWGDALIMYLLGDKQGAAQMVTGGAVKERTTFDRQGNLLREKYNQLGQIVDVVDLESGQALNPQEYGKRGGGLAQWENTLGFTKEKELLKNNIDNYQKYVPGKNRAFTNLSGAQVDANYVFSNADKIKGLDPKLQSEVWKAVSRNQATTVSSSKVKQLLDQTNNGANLRDGEDVGKKFGSNFGLGEGPITFNKSTGNLENKTTGSSISLSKLKNEGDTTTASSNFENSFSQGQKDLAMYLKTAGISADQQSLINDYYKSLGNLQKRGMELEMDKDRPNFLASIPYAEITDPVKAGKMTALMFFANKDILDKNIEYVKKAESKYGKGEVINVPEADAAFTRTKDFQNWALKAAAGKDAISRQQTETPVVEKQMKKMEAKIPPAVKVQSIGKAPEKAKKSLDAIFGQ